MAEEDIERRERTYRDSLCIMCSDAETRSKHHHFSSTSIRRMFMTPVGNHTTYMCPICKTLEPVRIPPSDTRRIVLASSTLYGVWNQPLPSGTIHFDIDSIVGGKVRDMTRALTKNYLHMPNRVEVIVVAGINNIGAGERAEDIKKEMDELREVVKKHSQKWKHSPPSYVVFCTVIYPPKFCSLYVPPNPPEPEVAEWVPPPTFINKYSEIKRLNDLIINQHEELGLKLVRLDYYGVKRLNPEKWMHKFDNRPGTTQVWREAEVFKKLHFTIEVKVKIIKYISDCFRTNGGEPEKGDNTGHD